MKRIDIEMDATTIEMAREYRKRVATAVHFAEKTGNVPVWSEARCVEDLRAELHKVDTFLDLYGGGH